MYIPSKEFIMVHSRIYGRKSNSKMAKLTKYQESINNAAMELCLQNPNLLDDRKALLEASRKKLDDSGYVYKKGRSRSKLLSSGDGESPVKKRAKINKDIRVSRIAELQDQIKDKSEQLQFKELRRDASKNVHNYKECDKLTEQMSILKADRRQLQLELTALTRKQKKAEWYLSKKSTSLKATAPQRNSNLRFISSSPEPRSPSSSFSAPQTPISCYSSLCSSPSPNLSPPPQPTHSSTPRSDSRTTVLSTHDSDDTVVVSSDESSCLSPCGLPNHVPQLKRQNAFLLCNDHSSHDGSPFQFHSENTSTPSQPLYVSNTHSHQISQLTTLPQPLSQSATTPQSISQFTCTPPQPLSHSTTPPQPLSHSTTPPQPISHSTTPAQPISHSTTPPQPISHSTTPPQPISHSTTPAQPISHSTTPPQPISHSTTPPQPISHSTTPPQPISHSTTPPQPISHSTTPAQPISHSTTPPQPISHSTTPPQPLSHSTTPPQPISHSTTPPQPISHSTTPPQPISHSTTPPQPISHLTTPPQPISHSTTPPQPISHSTTPPQPISHSTTPPQPISHSTTPPQPTSSTTLQHFQ